MKLLRILCVDIILPIGNLLGDYCSIGGYVDIIVRMSQKISSTHL